MERKLTLYYTSDTHGRLFPEDAAGGACLAQTFAEYQKDENTLVLDGGDTLQGSPLLRYLWNTDQCAAVLPAVMNRSGLDYFTLGNHDFNYGYEGLAGYLNGVKGTCLCANVIERTPAQSKTQAAAQSAVQDIAQNAADKAEAQSAVQDIAQQTSAPSLGIKPYTIHTLGNGLRVGIVGVVTDYVNLWEAEENLTHFVVTDAFEAAKEALKALKSVENGVDYTVCIYHGGFEADISQKAEAKISLPTQCTAQKKTDDMQGEAFVPDETFTVNASHRTQENVGCKICKELDFDLLLTAHQHMEAPLQMLDGTAVLQLPANAEKYARLEITVDTTHTADGAQAEGSSLSGHSMGTGAQTMVQNTDKIHTKTVRAEHIKPTATPDADLLAQMQSIRTAAKEWLSQPAGSLAKAVPAEMDKTTLAAGAAPLAQLANFAQLTASGAEVAITSLPNQAVGLPEQLTVGDVLTAYPFPNAVITLAVPGALLAKGIARSASYFALDEAGKPCVSTQFMKPKEEHYNYDFFAGVSYTVSPLQGESAAPIVTDIMVNGAPLDPARVYHVVMSDYRATGTGGYEFYADCARVASHPCDVQALILDLLAQKPDFEIPTLSWVNLQF